MSQELQAAQPWDDERIAPNGRSIAENFQAWFGQSKVVDHEGKPLRLFHGTAKDFDSFDRRRARGWAENNVLGHFLTRWSGSAGMYAGDDVPGANVIPVYVCLSNPYIQDVYEWQDMQSTSPRWSRDKIMEWRASLIEQGYDGIIDSIGVEFIAFKASQIKSAIGNSGLFLKNSSSLTDSVDSMALEKALKAKKHLMQLQGRKNTVMGMSP